MKRLVAAALAVTLMSSAVLAQARDHDRDRDRHSRQEAREHRDHDRHARRHGDHDRHVVRHHHDDRRWRDRHDSHADRRHDRPARFHVGHYHRPVGYRAYAWHRGARLPAAYYAPRYIVHDYRHYHLDRPPHGHHWVRVDRDVVLAAITTGAVVAVVSDLFH